MSKRHDNKRRTRIRKRNRAFQLRMRCDPRRLWPHDSDQYLDWHAAQSGRMDLMLKRLYRPSAIDDLIYGKQPLFAQLASINP